MQGLRPGSHSLDPASPLRPRLWAVLALHRLGFTWRPIGEPGGAGTNGAGTAIGVVRAVLSGCATERCPGEEQPARRNEGELVHPDRDHPRWDPADVEPNGESDPGGRPDERPNHDQSSTGCR